MNAAVAVITEVAMMAVVTVMTVVTLIKEEHRHNFLH